MLHLSNKLEELKEITRDGHLCYCINILCMISYCIYEMQLKKLHIPTDFLSNTKFLLVVYLFVICFQIYINISSQELLDISSIRINYVNNILSPAYVKDINVDINVRLHTLIKIRYPRYTIIGLASLYLSLCNAR